VRPSALGVRDLKKCLSAVALFFFAFSAQATTYYLAPAGAGGSDSNSGLSANTPWLTPNHHVNCGDVILAAPSSAYAATNFRINEWGVVSCASGNNVAWLKCQVFDACKITINSTGHNAMTPSQSYWGVQGWEVTATTISGNQCFEAYPRLSTTSFLRTTSQMAAATALSQPESTATLASTTSRSSATSPTMARRTTQTVTAELMSFFQRISIAFLARTSTLPATSLGETSILIRVVACHRPTATAFTSTQSTQ
jgi:hypothetical protein